MAVKAKSAAAGVMLKAALVYAEQFHFSVFPCRPRGKEPLTKHGLKEANQDAAAIRAWWKRWPRASVGIATGAASGIVVLDVDAKADGRETLAMLEDEQGRLPETPTVLTGGGGQHLYFRDPGGIRNSAGRLGAGLDVRGDGGYVIAPPSIHPNGNEYRWEVSSRIGEVELPDVPLWLLERMKPRAAERFELPAKVSEGKRNDTLYRLGRSLRARGLAEPEILAALTAANGQRCDPPLPVREIAEIAQSAATEPNRRDFGRTQAASDGRAGSSATPADGAASLPIINRYNKRLRELVDESLEALVARNRRGATIFQRSGALARIKSPEAAAEIEMLDADSLGLDLDRAADWIHDTGQKHTKVEPPERVVRSLLKLPSYELPSLRGIEHAPFFAAGGRLVAKPGYDPVSGVFLESAGLAALDEIPERPSPEHVRMAVEYLRGELLHGFPFAGEADRANAIGLLLTPFVRPMIEGLVPLFAIDSPAPGTGKSLLASVVHIVATGRQAATGVEQLDPGEAVKAITATLLQAPPIVLLDNVARHLVSGPFAAVLTAASWTARVLGQSKMVTVENRSVWIATGNNLTLATELRRRAVEIRLDAQRERPEERSDFRHPELRAWTREHRPALVHSALTLIQNWIALGQRTPSLRPLGGFENWSRIIGGILSAAGIADFLGNAEVFRQRADLDVADWRRLVAEWAAANGPDPVSTTELRPIAEGLIAHALGSGNERSQQIKLGLALNKRVGQVFADWRIEKAEYRDEAGRPRHGFRLTRAGAREGV